MAKKTRVRRSADEIRTIVKDFEQSGLSRVAFGQSRGINPSVLSRWVQKERGTGPGTGQSRVVPVNVVSKAVGEPDGSGVELRLRGGMTIHVNRGFDEETLSKVIRAFDVQC